MDRCFQGLLVPAGLLGALGVAAAAAAAHGSFPPSLNSAALIMLVHAGPILALALVAPRQIFWLVASLLLTLGALLFGIEVSLSAILGAPPLPLAAPLGGWCMMLGWLALAGAGIHKALKRPI
jgi:uncharacterized membrane protein YgdD (TMEM256/DUF423 family)